MELGAKVRRVLDALRALDVGQAHEGAAELARRSPEDSDILALAELTAGLRAAGDLDGLGQAYRSQRPPHRLVTAQLTAEAPLLERGLRAAAFAIGERAERERGGAAEVGGWPVARFYLEAGEAGPARSSAEAALRERGESALLLTCLADSYALVGDEPSRVEARDLYRQAFVLDPVSVDLSLLVDREVRDLPSLAEVEYEIEGDPTPWLAAVGYLEGLLPIAHIDESAFARMGEEELFAPPALPGSPEGFYHYLQVSESHRFFGERGGAIRLEARRRLKTIAPELYAHYLQRF